MSDEATQDSEALRAALLRASQHPGSWDELYLTIECRDEERLRAVKVWGSGVAVWDRGRQFQLAAVDIADLLGRLADADLAAFEDRYGEQPGPGDPLAPQPPDSRNAVLVTCRIELRLDDLGKSVVQLSKGYQSTRLKSLATALLDDLEAAGQAGVSAADLDDGLDKIRRGELAPEVLMVLLHRRPDRSRQKPSPAGFLLRLEGTRATSRTWDPASGYAPPVTLELAADDVKLLVGALVEAGVRTLPGNLYAAHYTDLVVELLDRRKTVQARRFAGLSPTSLGEDQRRFDGLYAQLASLHRRVQDQGVVGVDREGPP